MAKVRGFIEYKRETPKKKPVSERIQNFKEFEQLLPDEKIIIQSARCIDCGIPFCHLYGCPLNNRICDWNDLVYKNHWKKALDLLQSTNNFPEFTGRICPALCEKSCTLSINDDSVTIRNIELAIIEKGWNEGWIKPQTEKRKNGEKIAIIGSGPSGLAASQLLTRRGYNVIVFEKNKKIGGLLRYGIPDFKLEKWVIDRRLKQLEDEGIIFETDVNVGIDISTNYLKRTFDAIIIATGVYIPRDLNIPGRDLSGIHFAMDYLVQQNKLNNGEITQNELTISAKDKNVIVIGGGDTGSDCVGTAIRQGAKSVTQVELLPKPPMKRLAYNMWPQYPKTFTISSSHEEGCKRLWSLSATKFEGVNETVKKVYFNKLEWNNPDRYGNMSFHELKDEQIILEADLILLAMGFLHTEHNNIINYLEIETNQNGNIEVDEKYMTKERKFFATGDCITGSSLVVKAINHGRKTAYSVDQFLNSI